jgi:tetratricopeptide (TPR) repeat protein
MNADEWYELGLALARRGESPAACTALLNALRLDERARTLRALGNLLFDSGQYEAALRCFERLDRTHGS